MKVSALFNDTHPCEDADRRKRPHGMPGGVRTHSLKITQKNTGNAWNVRL